MIPAEIAPAASLTVVGCGIRAPAQATLETAAHIERATTVFTLLADPLAHEWVRLQNPATESLTFLYSVAKSRWDTYAEIVSRVVERVRSGARVCVVAYGHPGVFAYPLHEAVRQTRIAGYPAEMLAGISADACLFAELGIDPSVAGCRSFEATDFLVRQRPIDPSADLILWQIGLIGEPSWKPQSHVWNPLGLQVLGETLLAVYPADHEVVVFEAARYSGIASRIERIPLAALAQTRVSAMSTLYVAALARPRVNLEIARRLGIDPSDARWRPSALTRR